MEAPARECQNRTANNLREPSRTRALPVETVHAAMQAGARQFKSEARFWWAIGKTRLAAGKCGYFGGNDAHSHEVSRHDFENARKRPGQRMQRTALIVQIKRAVMVIGIRVCDSRI